MQRKFFFKFNLNRFDSVKYKGMTPPQVHDLITSVQSLGPRSLGHLLLTFLFLLKFKKKYHLIIIIILIIFINKIT